MCLEVHLMQMNLRFPFQSTRPAMGKLATCNKHSGFSTPIFAPSMPLVPGDAGDGRPACILQLVFPLTVTAPCINSLLQVFSDLLCARGEPLSPPRDGHPASPSCCFVPRIRRPFGEDLDWIPGAIDPYLHSSRCVFEILPLEPSTSPLSTFSSLAAARAALFLRRNGAT